MVEAVEGADPGQRGQFLAIDARARDEVLYRVKPYPGFGIRDSPFDSRADGPLAQGAPFRRRAGRELASGF